MGWSYKAEIPDPGYWQKRVLCQVGCPVSTDAGRYVQLIAEGRYRDAYLTARSPNPLASVCGRICAAPCEDRCRRGFLDSPIAIRALKRFVCEKFGAESSRPDTFNDLIQIGQEPGNKMDGHLPLLPRSKREQKVAIIGAGPAGLACAHDLALMGYRVTLFEASDTLGGMLQRIPRVPVCRGRSSTWRFPQILGLGVELKASSPLGPDFGLAELRREGFAAVLSASACSADGT